MGLLDINRLSEDVLIPILAEVYDYTHLVNLNSHGENYPGIDLGDEIAGVAFQITSDAGSSKITKTLKKFVENEFYEQYSHLVIYIITEKQRSYSGRGWDEIIGGRFKFAKENDIRDRIDLLRVIGHLPIEKIQKIETHLEKHFGEIQRISVGEHIPSVRRLPQPDAIEQYWAWLSSNLQDLISAQHLAILQTIVLPIRLGSSEQIKEYRLVEEGIITQNMMNTTSWILPTGDGSGVKDNQDITDLVHALRAHRRLLIVGDSGSGKSTLLRRFARLEAKRLHTNGFAKARRYTPVLVELWRFSLDRPLLDLIIRSVKRSGVDISQDELLVAVERGYVALLLDGLDEVSVEHRQECLAQIINFLEDYPCAVMALTSRPFPEPPNQFYRLAIMPITDADIAAVLRVKFGSGREFRKRLNWHATPESFVTFGLRPEVRQLCRRPLTLGMILTLLANDGKLPENLYKTYDRYLSWFLDWEVRRGLIPSSAATTAALEETAYVMADRNQMSLSNTDWVRIAGQATSKLRETGITTRPSAEEILQVLLSTGLMHDLGGEVYFSHRSLLEFLAARRIFSMPVPVHDLPLALHMGVARFLCNGTLDMSELLEKYLVRCDDVEMLMPLLREAIPMECAGDRFEALYDAIVLGQEMYTELTFFLKASEEEWFIERIDELVQTCLDFSPKALSVLKNAIEGVVAAGDQWQYSRVWFERIIEGLESYGWAGTELYRQFAKTTVFEIDSFGEDRIDLNIDQWNEEFSAFLGAIREDDFMQASKYLSQIEKFLQN